MCSDIFATICSAKCSSSSPRKRKEQLLIQEVSEISEQSSRHNPPKPQKQKSFEGAKISNKITVLADSTQTSIRPTSSLSLFLAAPDQNPNQKKKKKSNARCRQRPRRRRRRRLNPSGGEASTENWSVYRGGGPRFRWAVWAFLFN